MNAAIAAVFIRSDAGSDVINPLSAHPEARFDLQQVDLTHLSAEMH